MLYKRKRAPKHIRRKARRRYANFISKQLKAVNDNTNLFQIHGSSSALVNTQGMTSITSGYLQVGNAVDGVGNLAEFFGNIMNSSAANLHQVGAHFYLTGMSTDYTIVNTGAGIAEIDVYDFVFRKDHLTDEADNCSGVSSFLVNELGDESKLPGAAASMAATDLGYVPTDSNNAMKYIIIKSKQRFYVGNGQAFSFTKRIRFNTPIKLQGEDFASPTVGANAWIKAKRGVTRGIIMIYKGLPDATNPAAVSSLSFNAQTRYRGKYLNLEYNKNATGN